MLAAVTALAGCGSSGTGDDEPTAAPPRRVLSAVQLSLAAISVEVGEGTVARATALDQFGTPIATAAPATYASTAPEVAGVGPTSGAVLAVGPGSAQISATIEGKTDRRTVTVVGAAIRINEVRPNGNLPDGWVEMFNPTTADVDMSGWTVTSGDPARSFTIPSGAVIPAGGYLAVNEGTLPLGLKPADGVRLFSRFGVQVDSFSWTVSPPTSYGRCPDGTGAFVTTTAPTRRAANECPGAGE
jgi:hypothetical protein